MKKREEEEKLDSTVNEVSNEETRKQVQISERSQEERLFLSGMLFEQTEDLAKKAAERRRKKDKEVVELQSGVKFTVGEITALVTSVRQPYSPKFPNENPFFKEVFRLNNWTHLDPNTYVKPPIVANYINEIIYGRFQKDILPALQALNPIIPGGTREFKLFQYLNEDGQKLIEQYRDDSVSLMKTCADGEWYEFRKKLYREYSVSYQVKMFEKND